MLPVITRSGRCALLAALVVAGSPSLRRGGTRRGPSSRSSLKDIRVEGLQRTDPGTVFAALPFRIGDTYNDDKGAAALRALFATGLFKDVRIEIEGKVAVIIVDERSIIAQRRVRRPEGVRQGHR